MYGIFMHNPYACVIAVVGYDDVMHFPYITAIGADLREPTPYCGSWKERHGPIRTYASYEKAEDARKALRDKFERDGRQLVADIERMIGLEPSPLSQFGDPWAGIKP